jgi:aldehyde dehydrogenase (NAD(P)+)
MQVLLEPLITAGYMDCAFDQRLDRNVLYTCPDLIAGVHMTGGKATHDAIVWGPNNYEQPRRPDQKPLLQVPMTSELGCVTP